MKSIHLQKLIKLRHESDCIKYPSMPPDYIALFKYTDVTANGLTRAVVDFLNLSGHQAERISTTGRYIDGSKVVTDTLGYKRTIGSGKYIPGNGKKGSADISSTIRIVINGRTIGMSVKWEVKIGKDRQSQHQKNYQTTIEEAAGEYFIIKSFDEFYNYYEKII